MASETARMAAARAWCNDTTKSKVMDPDLAEAFAEILDGYIEALAWCGGSADFHPGGQAHGGWQKVVVPLLHSAPKADAA
jgi:hypothetical protein